jgi:hypothetical protein
LLDLDALFDNLILSYPSRKPVEKKRLLLNFHRFKQNKKPPANPTTFLSLISSVFNHNERIPDNVRIPFGKTADKKEIPFYIIFLKSINNCRRIYIIGTVIEG